ncbi:MAG TPA: exodeoxyribonuclease VII small subunit [Prevotella sp.]|nr:exodeoxyribonuclease VII small subunit [Prevotella sp.]
MAKETKYEEAIGKLEDIVQRLENDEMGIDEMTAELKKAQQLIKLCKDRLTKTDAEIQKILSEGKD